MRVYRLPKEYRNDYRNWEAPEKLVRRLIRKGYLKIKPNELVSVFSDSIVILNLAKEKTQRRKIERIKQTFKAREVK